MEVQPETPLLLSIIAAGQRIGVSRSTILRMVDRGELRTVQVGARRLVPTVDVDGFVAGKLAEASAG